MMDRTIGAQLYTLRDYCKTEKDFAETMAKLKEIGYKSIQISGVGPLAPEFIKETADTYGMKIVCTHRPLKEFLESPKEVIRYHKALGTSIAGIGSAPREYMESAESLREFFKLMNPIAKELKENGMYFGYHNHAFEFSRIDKKWIMDHLVDETDPESFVFIPDVYWMAYAGINPAEYLIKLGKRAKVVHFKDLQVLEWTTITYTEVGEGNLDWDSIIKACDTCGAGCAVVEQDVCPGNPFDSMCISYNNLKAKGFN